MGCSGSHGTVTVLENGSATNGKELQIPKDVRRVSDVPPLEGTDIPSENIGNGTTTRPVTPRILVPPSTAFEIPLHDDELEDSVSSLVRRHPPRRLLRLEEQQREVPVTQISLDELREKQEQAELRRKQFLEARAMSAKHKFMMRASNGTHDPECA